MTEEISKDTHDSIDQLKKYLFSKTSAVILALVTGVVTHYGHDYIAPQSKSEIRLPMPENIKAAEFTKIQDGVWIVKPIKEYMILTQDASGTYKYSSPTD